MVFTLHKIKGKWYLHCIKYMGIQVFSDPFSPVFSHILRCVILSLGRKFFNNITFQLQVHNSGYKEGMKKREGKVEVKKETFRLLLVGVVYGNDELNNRADNLANYEEAIPVIREYKTIVRSQKNRILNVVYIQGFFFKEFREPNKFVETVKEIDVSKSTISFDVNLIKIFDKYQKLKNHLCH